MKGPLEPPLHSVPMENEPQSVFLMPHRSFDFYNDCVFPIIR